MQPYSPLLTDLYQLTMAYGYWKLNKHNDMACFELSYRHAPFNGHFAIHAGLQYTIDFLNAWHFSDDDLHYLADLQAQDGSRLFPKDFLAYLKQLSFSCDIDAILEGTLVFPHTPMLRIQGPLLQCQLLESPLLNFINFQTLIATKTARICQAARGDAVIEFGLRRAQGPDGAMSASRAAYIGGAMATSNTLAGKVFDIPVRGTHAHSWISSFENEREAFAAYAEVLPQNGIFLVDTYNTLEGVKHAIEIGHTLRSKGHPLQAVRLDSGDMAALSIAARELLDAAGFYDTAIMASNNLDEEVIRDLKQRGAKISIWGVGTHLVTAYDQPALDGVYKLTALQNKEGHWLPTLKLSEEPVKISTPGRHQIRRFYQNELPLSDMVYDLDLGISEGNAPYQDLLQPIFRKGKPTTAPESIHRIRDRSIASRELFLKAYANKAYEVSLEATLAAAKQKMILNKTAR